MECFGMTDIGRCRQDNQDSFLLETIRDGCLLALICDGMGGAAGGMIASSLAADVFSASLKKKLAELFPIDNEISLEKEAILETVLKDSAQEANTAVYNYAKDSIDLLGMGTTLVAALVIDQEVFICNVGDSRLYHLTATSMKQITKDHSYVQMLIDNGLLEPSLATAHPDRNVITRAIGTRALVTAETFRMRLHENETILLCSDGLSSYVSNEEIYTIIWGSREIYDRPTSEKVKALLDAANANGGRDNVTAVLITY